MDLLKYTDRDFYKIRDDLLKYVKSKLPEWSSISVYDPLYVYIEGVASLFNLLYANMDLVSSELFLDTALTKKGVIMLGKLLGRRPKLQSAARVNLKISFDGSQSSVTIKKGAKVLNDDGSIQFMVGKYRDLDANSGISVSTNTSGDWIFSSIPSGGETGYVEAFEQDFNTITLATSDGSAFQSYEIDDYDIIQKAYIKVGTEFWDEVEELEAGNGKVYKLEVNSDEKLVVKFGDGICGVIPPNGNSIVAEYYVGNGEEGNIGADILSRFDTSIVGVSSVSNPNPAYGGADVETVDEMKRNLRSFVRMLNRATSLKDFEDILYDKKNFDNGVVRKVKALIADKTIKVIVQSYTDTTQNFLDEVKSYLDSKKVVGVIVGVDKPVDYSFDVVMDLYVKDRFDKTTVASEVSNALQKYYKEEGGDLGKKIKVGDIYRITMEIEGVDYCKVNTPSSDIGIFDYQAPKLSNITITVTGNDGEVVPIEWKDIEYAW